ncbi:hypothetical protein [Buttiauxella agrestis]|uniref:Uncharacterized protein n=1 Tax=Buttiauxella agrestis ATCC 33320 TaxID=1006004 RepID=A0A085FZU1_9ENTR|nr:hypothetical protein [Buttiauxella agrestis]KFC76986.1 hypothetical protein GBAG_3951 [Buttiauxella agrestis ATCC 33320]
MDEEQLIKLMNDNGFTEKEVRKLLLTAEKYPATLEWIMGEFARHFKNIILSLLIITIFCYFIIMSINSIVLGSVIFYVYLTGLFLIYKSSAMTYVIKCRKIMCVIKQKYAEAERCESSSS